MRLSTSFLILLASTFVLAQHHDSGSAPAPAPAPSPSHSSAPTSPAPSPAPSFSSGATSSPNSVHNSAPTAASSPPVVAPSHTTAPAGTPGFAGSNTKVPEMSAGKSPAHAPEPTSRIVPGEKVSGESRVSPQKIGENPPEKERDGKADPELRRRICLQGPCETATKPAAPPDSDLRHRICLSGHCNCGAGQVMGKNGCVAGQQTVVQQEHTPCQPGQSWNGFSCSETLSCPASQHWDGTRCVPYGGQCANIDARAETMISELRALKARVTETCGQTPSGDECMASKEQLAGARQRYEMLLTEASAECRTMLPDPSSF